MTAATAPRHSPCPPARTARRWGRGDAGSASTELVIIMPLLLLLVLASVHVALWFHAAQVVTAASEEGARAARAFGATDADGYQRAEQMLRDLGPGTVTDPAVSVTRTAGSVTVSVSGQSPPVIPGLSMSVSATTTSPREVFKP